MSFLLLAFLIAFSIYQFITINERSDRSSAERAAIKNNTDTIAQTTNKIVNGHTEQLNKLTTDVHQILNILQNKTK